MKRIVRRLALELLAAIYLQLAAGGVLFTIVFPATSRPPQSVTTASTMPKPERRPVWVPARYLPLTSSITLEIPPCVPSPKQKHAILHWDLLTLPDQPVGYSSYRSSLLANKAPPLL